MPCMIKELISLKRGEAKHYVVMIAIVGLLVTYPQRGPRGGHVLRQTSRRPLRWYTRSRMRRCSPPKRKGPDRARCRSAEETGGVVDASALRSRKALAGGRRAAEHRSRGST